jgi:hypothetical protein
MKLNYLLFLIILSIDAFTKILKLILKFILYNKLNEDRKWRIWALKKTIILFNNNKIIYKINEDNNYCIVKKMKNIIY